MRETILSTCEKAFVLQAIAEEKRLDGRGYNEHRDMKICFGSDLGCCQVTLGQTRVLAQVSCEVQQPKANRPVDGHLLMFVELSPMAAPYFEVGRPSDLAIQLGRILEKCIRDSRAVDLESLCIKSEEKVWALRVDVTVMNHEGNLADAASVAALAALAHFRRPDFTAEGGKIIIHTPEEKDTIPVTLHHYPVCISYAIFNNGGHVVADPTELEERVSEAQLIFGMNSYRELCGVHLGGSALANPQIIIQCATRAAKRAVEVVDMIRSALEKDTQARAKGEDVSFVRAIKEGSFLSLAHEKMCLRLDSSELKTVATNIVEDQKVNRRENDDSIHVEKQKIVSLGNGSAELIDISDSKETFQALKLKSDEVGMGGPCQWKMSDTSSVEEIDSETSSEDHVQTSEETDSSDIEVVREVSFEERLKIVDSIELSGDSEEDETHIIEAGDISEIQESKRFPRSTAKKEESEDSTSQSRSWYQPKW